MTQATLINTVAIALAMVILWRAEPAIARMTAGTHWMIRYSLLFVAGGALGTILRALCGGQVDFFTLLVLAGLALLLFCDRRLRFLIAHRPLKGERHA